MRKEKTMKRIFGILLALALVLGFTLVAATPVAAAATWYVDPTGTDDGSHGTGTGTSAWKTIQYAVGQVGAGDTIMVAAGTYLELVTINKPITVLGATHDVNKNGYTVPGSYAWDDSVESIIQAPDPSAIHSAIVDIVDTSDVTFEGFVVEELSANSNKGDSLLRVYAHNVACHNIVVMNNVIGPFTNTSSQDGQQGRMALYLVNNPYSDLYGITNSHFSGNKIFGAEGNGDNIFIWSSYKSYGASGPASMSGTVIEDNEISGSHRSGIETAGGFSDLTIRNNRIFGNFKLGGDSPDLKYGNGIVMIRGSGDKADSLGFGPVDVTIENNDIHDNDGHGIYMGPNNQDVTITENNIYNNGDEGIIVDLIGNYWNPDFEVSAGPYTNLGGSTNVIADHNNIYNNGSGAEVNGTPTNGFVLDATYSWWGADDGPSGAGPGGGDAVSANVDFVPWACQPATGGLAYLTPSAGVIDDLTPVVPPTGAPVSLPYGMFSFTITGLTPGGGGYVTITVELPGPVPVGSRWWKYQGGLWYSLPIGDDNGDNVITVTLHDGALHEDTDGSSTNGEITDPGGPSGGAVGWETYPISKVRVLLPWIILGAAIAAGASLLVLRRRRTKARV
jgi:parallel beta-helix repeat protein